MPDPKKKNGKVATDPRDIPATRRDSLNLQKLAIERSNFLKNAGYVKEPDVKKGPFPYAHQDMYRNYQQMQKKQRDSITTEVIRLNRKGQPYRSTEVYDPKYYRQENVNGNPNKYKSQEVGDIGVLNPAVKYGDFDYRIDPTKYERWVNPNTGDGVNNYIYDFGSKYNPKPVKINSGKGTVNVNKNPGHNNQKQVPVKNVTANSPLDYMNSSTIKYADGGQIHNDLDGKYNNYLNNNMKQYAQGGKLTRFDEGGTHEQNPLGGIPQGQDGQGNMNTVEQGETKKGNFVYSDRIALDKNLIKQFNLPGYVANKSVSEASKAIDNQFKDRQDKYAQETKKTLLDRLSQAQEHLKAQEQAQQQQINQSMQANSQQVPDMMEGQIPEGMEEYMEQSQSQNPQEEMMGGQQPMARGGYMNRYDDGGYISDLKPAGLTDLSPYGAQISTNTSGLNNIQPTENNTQTQSNTDYSKLAPIATGVGNMVYNQDAQKSATLGTINAVGSTAGGTVGKYVSGATGLYDMGQEAFGKSGVDTSGKQSVSGASAGRSAGSGALKGMGTGATIGSIIPGVGTVIGAGVGAIVGGVTGLIGGKKDEKAQAVNNKKYSLNINKQFDDPNWAAYGGTLDVGVKPTTGNSTIRPSVKMLKYGGDIDPPVKFLKPPAGYNTNPIQNFHDITGVSPDTPGYGQEFGKKSNKLLFDYNVNIKDPDTLALQKKGKTTYTNTKEDIMNKTWNDVQQKKYGITAEGYRDMHPENDVPTLDQKIPDFVPETGVLASMEKNYQDVLAKRTTEANKKSIVDKAGDFVKNHYGEAMRYAPIAMNAYQLSQLKKPQGVQYHTSGDKYKPQYVDETQLQNIAAQNQRNQINAVSESGGSEGANRAAILGSGVNFNRGLSEAYLNMKDRNMSMDDRAQQFDSAINSQNIAIRNRAIDEMRADKGNYDTQKSKLLGAIGTDIGSVGKEEVNKDQIAAMLGYTWRGNYMVDEKGQRVTAEKMAKDKAALEASNEKPAYNSKTGEKITYGYGGFLKTYNKR